MVLEERVGSPTKVANIREWLLRGRKLFDY
jgi:hypothetical protein